VDNGGHDEHSALGFAVPAFDRVSGARLAPPPDIAALMNASLPRWFQLFLGVAEVMAAAGLTLPGVTRIMPWLVSWAAAGIMVVMVSATIFHLVRGEISSAATTVVLLAMATFVAYMRNRTLPIAARRLNHVTRQHGRTAIA
jgi:putative oxidoreductase